MSIRFTLAALLALMLATGASGQQQPEASPAVAVPLTVPPPPSSTVAAAAIAEPPICSGLCGDCCVPANGLPGQAWGSVDALFWWIKGTSLPALVTTSPAGTARVQAGVLGQPGTSVVFGDSWANGGFRVGTQVNLGYWFDPGQNYGIQANVFGVENLGSAFGSSSSGSPILARPFLDVTTGLASSTLIAFPGLASGNVRVDSTSTSLVGAGIWLRENVCCSSCYRLDALAGYRYLHFGDSLGIAENVTNLSSASLVPIGATLAATDAFKANNHFDGFDIGLVGQAWRGRWVFEGQAKMAVGFTSELMQVLGSTKITVPGSAPVIQSGGLLALSSNIGSYHNDTWGLVPEFNGRVGYQVNSHIYCFLGYTFLYWSNVVRAASQIDQGVNPNLIPPATGQAATNNLRPIPLLSGSDLWAQGINLGVEFRF